jgi:hypothetical protein
MRSTKSARAFLILLFWTCCACCSAQQVPLPAIPGLSLAIYRTFSGVWDENPRAESLGNSRKGNFSWGMSIYNPLGSVLIDLGSDTPYVQEYGSRVDVLEIEDMGSGRIKLTCRGVTGPMKQGHLELTLEEGVLRFREIHVPAIAAESSSFSLSTIRGLRRLSGPPAEDPNQPR